MVVDDELDICRAIHLIFTEIGHNVEIAHNIKSALEMIHTKPIDVIFIDIELGREDGLDLIKPALEFTPEAAVVLITSFGSVESAVKAMKMGAYDYICKPFINDELVIMVNRIFEVKNLVKKNKSLKKELNDVYSFESLSGSSRAISKIRRMIKKVLTSDVNVLITGETGTGKSLAAHLIHHHGARNEFPLITINCGAIPENLLESELFGYKKGAFTGAIKNKNGLFEKAHKGTIFLDEVSELPLNMQVKLLHAIQEKEIMPIGGTETIKFDARIIAASNKNLYMAVKEGAFREDLYYRLNVVELPMVPLREHKEDIPELVHTSLTKFCNKSGKTMPKVSKEVMELFQNYSWFGNVRELENVIEGVLVFCEGSTIEMDDVIGSLQEDDSQVNPDGIATDLKSKIMIFEKEYITNVLEKHNNNKAAAARYLNINLTTLYRKLER